MNDEQFEEEQLARENTLIQALARKEAQLNEALKLILHAKDELRTGPSYEWEDRLAGKLGTFLSQAEQQEAPKRGKPDWSSHGYDQIFQTSDGNWFGARAGWDFKGHISDQWKGREVSLLRDDGGFLAYGEQNPDWENSLEQRPAQEAQGAQAGDERAAFEGWAQGFGWAATEMTWQVDRYLDEDLQLQWSGWQARAALATQPAAGGPEQQTSINADDLPTKKYPLAAFDFDSPSSAPVAAGEQAPIGYANPKHLASMAAGTRAIVPILPSICPGLHHTEPVYTAPPAAAHGDEYEIWAAAQLAPGEGIEDGAKRIRDLIGRPAAHGDEAVLTFEYVGPRNERKTVEVTREEVADHLDYMLFEKLTAAVCGCDPAESDDCRCDEYADQFTMRAQAGEGGEV